MASLVLDLRQTIIEEALRNAALQEALLDQLEDGIYVVDRERRILFWNSAAERISGYMEHEVTGQFCQNGLLMHCDADGRILCGERCPLAAVMHDGVPRECEVFLRHREGHRVPVQVRSRPLYDPHGVTIGAVEIFREAAALTGGGVRSPQAFGCWDQTTGAATREYGEMRFWQAMDAFEKFEIPLGWLRISLECAEGLEQRCGQDGVTSALKKIAATLSHNVGSFDVVTRWSETEFRIEAHGCSWPELAGMARKLVALAETSSVVFYDSRFPLRISVAAAMAERGDTLQSLEARLSELFVNRQSGDNCLPLADRLFNLPETRRIRERLIKLS